MCLLPHIRQEFHDRIAFFLSWSQPDNGLDSRRIYLLHQWDLGTLFIRVGLIDAQLVNPKGQSVYSALDVSKHDFETLGYQERCIINLDAMVSRRLAPCI